ncbi:MAG: isochorismatase family protein [Clostridiales Family XIII bacterium]|nr:isochorismatase family protein [Clostridiales Family XIII bacterium]
MSVKKNHKDESDAVLIVIDMQEKLVPAMREMHNLIYRADTLLRGCALMNVPVIFTQQYTQGLGHTINPIKEAYVEAVSSANENVKLAVEDQIVPPEHIRFTYIEKTSFNVMDEPGFVTALEQTGRREVMVCGIESHVCVLQSAEDLSARGYTVQVAADATSSRREIDSAFAYSRMIQKGITVTTSEALLFDLMKDSNHPVFRQISALLK